MSSCLLSNLPVELLSKIVAYVPSSADLVNLSLCSKRIESVTSEYLYHEIKLVHNSGSENIFRDYEILKALATRMLRQPELSKCVKRLKVRWDWNQRDIDHDRFKNLLDEYTKLGPRSQNRGFFREREVDTLSPSTSPINSITVLEEMLIVTIIASLPNLCILDIFLPCYVGTTYELISPSYSLRAGLLPLISEVGSGMLDNVVEVLLGDKVPSGGKFDMHVDPRDYMPYFYLERVRKVVLCGLAPATAGEDMDDQVWQYDPGQVQQNDHLSQKAATRLFRQSNVQHVELRSCGLNWPELCRIVNSCHSLHTFVMDRNTVCHGYIEPTLKALKRHKDTLRNLSFHDIVSRRQGHDLSHFHVLEHLHIESNCLVGAPYGDGREVWEQPVDETFAQVQQNLPRNLRSLTVIFSIYYVYHPNVFTGTSPLPKLLTQMVQKRHVYWPHLQSIRVFMAGPFRPYDVPPQSLCCDGVVQAYYDYRSANEPQVRLDVSQMVLSDDDWRYQRWDAMKEILWDPKTQGMTLSSDWFE